jgi:hypothetical protein
MLVLVLESFSHKGFSGTLFGRQKVDRLYESLLNQLGLNRLRERNGFRRLIPGMSFLDITFSMSMETLDKVF